MPQNFNTRLVRPVEALGNPEDVREDNPDRAQTSAIALWRGVLYELQNLTIMLGGTLDVTQSGVWNVTNITGTVSLPTGAATSAKQDTGNTSLASIDTKMSTLAGYVDGLETLNGAVNETAPATDTASSGANGRLQRIAQRITSMIALLPAALGAGGGLKSEGNSASGATDSGNPVKVGGVYSSTRPTFTDGQRGDLQLGTRGNLAVTLFSANSPNAVDATAPADALSNSVAGLISVAYGHMFNGASWDRVRGDTTNGLDVDVTRLPALVAGSALVGRAAADATAATGGITTTARLASAANSTNALRVKASAGRIYSIEGKNNAAYDVFLVLYDATTSPPVPGTTTIRKKICCPAGQAFERNWPLGLEFATGIGYAFTKLVADADTTVLAAADITAFNMDYV